MPSSSFTEALTKNPKKLKKKKSLQKINQSINQIVWIMQVQEGTNISV